MTKSTVGLAEITEHSTTCMNTYWMAMMHLPKAAGYERMNLARDLWYLNEALIFFSQNGHTFHDRCLFLCVFLFERNFWLLLFKTLKVYLFFFLILIKTDSHGYQFNLTAWHSYFFKNWYFWLKIYWFTKKIKKKKVKIMQDDLFATNLPTK